VRSVCRNALRVRTEIVDAAVIDGLKARLGDETLLANAVRCAVAELTACHAEADAETTIEELYRVDLELRRVGEQMVTAVGTDSLAALVDQIRRLGDRRRALLDQQAGRAVLRRQSADAVPHVLAELQTRLRDWPAVLTDKPRRGARSDHATSGRTAGDDAASHRGVLPVYRGRDPRTVVRGGGTTIVGVPTGIRRFRGTVDGRAGRTHAAPIRVRVSPRQQMGERRLLLRIAAHVVRSFEIRPRFVCRVEARNIAATVWGPARTG
jgi:hypothetical protein